MTSCLASFSGALQALGHTHPPPTSGDLLCQLLEADGSPLCGGPVGTFPEVGVPRVRLGRKDYGYCREGTWLLLEDAQDPWGLWLSSHAQPAALEGSNSASDDHRVLAQSGWPSLSALSC